MRLVRRSALLALLCAGAFPLPVLAQLGGYYFDLSAGGADAKVEPIFSTSRGADVSEMKASGEMAALTGGWRFNDNVSVEISVARFGEFSGSATLVDDLILLEVDPLTQQGRGVNAHVDLRADTAEYSLTSFNASVLGTWPFSRRWSAYGELGIAAWEVESELEGSMKISGETERDRLFSADLSDSGSSFFYGFGLHYRFNLDYGVRLEYQMMKVDSEIFSSDADLRNLNLGLRIYF